MYRTDISFAHNKVSELYTLPSNELDVQQLKSSNIQPQCFQTDERYFCKGDCCWKGDCKALTATWLRRG